MESSHRDPSIVRYPNPRLRAWYARESTVRASHPVPWLRGSSVSSACLPQLAYQEG